VDFGGVGGVDVLQIDGRGRIANVKNFDGGDAGDMRRFVEEIAFEKNGVDAVETVRDVASGCANAAEQNRRGGIGQRDDMQAAAAPTAEIANLVSDCAQLELVVAGRTGAVNAE